MIGRELLFGCVLAGLGTIPGTTARADATVTVSILPLAGIVEELTGEPVDVLVGPGETPELYEPKARQLVALSSTQALVVVGVPFETTFLPRVRRQFPELPVIDAAAGIERIELPGHGDGDHVHEHEIDPHLWTDPILLKRMATTIADELVRLEPTDADSVRARLARLNARYDALDADLRTVLEDVSPKVIAVFHPSFGYFAQRYGFEQVAVESGGSDPGPKHLAGLKRRLHGLGVEVLFVQPQFSPQRARALNAVLDVRLVEIDPLARDVDSMLRSFARALVTGVEGATR